MVFRFFLQAFRSYVRALAVSFGDSKLAYFKVQARLMRFYAKLFFDPADNNKGMDSMEEAGSLLLFLR